MFSVITNIYNESQRAYLNGIFHSHRKIEKFFFWQLEIFDVCTAGDAAHIEVVATHPLTDVDACVATNWIVCRVTRSAHIEYL